MANWPHRLVRLVTRLQPGNAFLEALPPEIEKEAEPPKKHSQVEPGNELRATS